MGWLDYHLHEFRLLDGKNKIRAIGIPTGQESPDERAPIPLARARLGPLHHQLYHTLPALYVYDFGDDWEHALIYEGEQPVESSGAYPRCVAGARRCPPEDCGGVHGYVDFLAAIADPAHSEHEASLTWVGGSYDPDGFDPAKVVFDDPLKRWKTAFERQPS